ncbi:MAG: putative dehydrogenase [Verrucomicrobiales bacterium]|jgi:predicted dehydrogenase
MSEENDDYGLSPTKKVNEIAPPAIDYKPPRPKSYRPKIAMIGTGGISEFHLKAYKKCGFEVAAIMSRTRSKAEARRDEFYPNAEVYGDYRAILDRDDIEVVDVTPHPAERLPILRACLEAGKHVLSQKPFVTDLDDGQQLLELAESKGVKLAVNQNGRWAPHFSYFRNAVATGLIGEVTSIDLNLQWDQTWISGNEEFEKIHHLVLYDFGVHWFDCVSSLMKGREPKRVFASALRFDEQVFRPPAIASAIVDFDGAQARLCFNAHTKLGEEDVTTVVGTKGTLRSRGPGLNDQPEMEVFLEAGQCRVPLEGCWFESGFEGAMGEMLCAIEEDREPNNSARGNLKSLELCFAALKSADTGEAIVPGSIRRIG